MTPRERVQIALSGGHADRVPFTIYERKIPQCVTERSLRNRGLCIVKRDVPVYREQRPHVRETEIHLVEDGRPRIRRTIETPAGMLTSLSEPAGFTSWRLEYPFKSPDDYKAIRFWIEDTRYEPCYDVFTAAERAFGDDAIFRANLPLEPLQWLVSGGFFNTETFCVEWMERRDELLKLYALLVEQNRRVYPLVAQSPAGHANYGGNVTPEIIGLERFERYYVPHYNEAAEVMHRHGKLLGCHFDANCRLLAAAIAGTALDYIEAFTPAPDTDMTLAEARAAWPRKAIWMNYPSSVHLRPPAEVERVAFDLIVQAGSPDGLIMGITEDIPPDRWQASCTAIMDGLERHARTNPALYSTLSMRNCDK